MTSKHPPKYIHITYHWPEAGSWSRLIEVYCYLFKRRHIVPGVHLARYTSLSKKRPEISLAEFERLSALPVKIRGKSGLWPFGVILSYLCKKMWEVPDVRLPTWFRLAIAMEELHLFPTSPSKTQRYDAIERYVFDLSTWKWVCWPFTKGPPS